MRNKSLMIAFCIFLATFGTAIGCAATNKNTECGFPITGLSEEALGAGIVKTGTDVKYAIKEYTDEYSVLVCTKENPEGIVYGYSIEETDGIYLLGEKVTTDIADIDSIIDSTKYNTTVIRNAEDNIIGIKFEEK